MADGINTTQNQAQGDGNQNQATQNTNAGVSNQGTTKIDFDYEKLAGIVSGAQSVKEEAVLKNYFKQQGLSQDEVTQAISQFKAQKEANTPNLQDLQEKLTQAQTMAHAAQIDSALQIAALKGNVEISNLPYVLKLVDRSTLTVDSTEDDYIAAVNKVLEDVPALKKTDEQGAGFQKVGAGATGGTNTSQADALKKIFGN